MDPRRPRQQQQQQQPAQNNKNHNHNCIHMIRRLTDHANDNDDDVVDVVLCPPVSTTRTKTGIATTIRIIEQSTVQTTKPTTKNYSCYSMILLQIIMMMMTLNYFSTHHIVHRSFVLAFQATATRHIRYCASQSERSNKMMGWQLSTNRRISSATTFSNTKPTRLSLSSETPTTTSTSTTINGQETVAAATNEQPKKQKVVLRRVLSGVQPTGSLHLGNYLGAIRQWVDFQNYPNRLFEQTNNNANETTNSKDEQHDDNTIYQTENYFCVVDLHAITMPHDPIALYESTLASAALYLAAGIDPAKSKVFVQSHVSEHSELTWLLNCITPINWLERMIQYKEKSSKNKESVGVGLFTYPILMASDILLYQATHVPVGEDQRQHLELTRDIVRRFHDLFCKGNSYKKRCKEFGIASRPTFTEFNAMILKETGRVMSLTDGTQKMSKSDPNDNSRINILDPPDIIQNKIKRCKTDEYIGIEWDNPLRPEATNLLNIYSAVSNITKDEIMTQVSNMTWGEFKPILAQAIIEHVQPIQEKYYEIRTKDNGQYLLNVLHDGAVSAKQIASQTLYNTKIAMGFVPSSSSSLASSSSVLVSSTNNSILNESK